MLTKILHYGFRRPEDFDEYEALRLSEQLAISARLASDPKAPSYEAIMSTLRQKIGSAVDQFKAYFSALLADKEYSRILDAVHKVDKAFKPGTNSVQRETLSLPSARTRPPFPVVGYSCGLPGHIASRCFRRPRQDPYPWYRPYNFRSYGDRPYGSRPYGDRPRYGRSHSGSSLPNDSSPPS